jgi:hypothetical protein
MLFIDDTGYHRYFDLQFQGEDDQVFTRTKQYWQQKSVQAHISTKTPPLVTANDTVPS